MFLKLITAALLALTLSGCGFTGSMQNVFPIDDIPEQAPVISQGIDDHFYQPVHHSDARYEINGKIGSYNYKTTKSNGYVVRGGVK